MKYSIVFTAIIGATSVAAFPLEATGSDIALRSRGFLDSVGSWFGATPSGGDSQVGHPAQGGVSAKTNTVSDALNVVANGGSINVQTLRVLQDANFAADALATLKLDGTTKMVTGLLTNQNFLVQAGNCFTNQTFINELADVVSETHFTGQLATLTGNPAVLTFASDLLTNNAIFTSIKAALGPNMNLGGYLSGMAQTSGFLHLATALTGNGNAQLAAHIKALLSDKMVIAKMDALLDGKGDFSAELIATLQDSAFVTHVCSVLGVAPEIATKIVSMLSAGGNFGGSLEGLLGSNYKGQVTQFIGTGSAGSLVANSLGKVGGNFNSLVYNYVGDGQVVGNIGSLLGSSGYQTELSGMFQGLLSGNLDLNAIITQLMTTAQPLLQACAQAVMIPVQLVQKVVGTIMSSGIVNLLLGGLVGGGAGANPGASNPSNPAYPGGQSYPDSNNNGVYQGGYTYPTNGN